MCIINDFLIELTSVTPPVQWISTQGARAGFTINSGSQACRRWLHLTPLLNTPKSHGFSETFLGHNSHCAQTPCMLGRGSSRGAGGGIKSIAPLRPILSLYPVQPLSMQDADAPKKGTLPGATFIYEALILTMATSVRCRVEPQHKASSPLSPSVGRWGTGRGRRPQPPPEVVGGDRLP